MQYVHNTLLLVGKIKYEKRKKKKRRITVEFSPIELALLSNNRLRR